jgi:hypothetical protein
MKEIENFPLQNEYEEYLEIIKTIPEDSKIEVEYYPDIARDMKAKALGKLSADSSVEEISKALKKATVVKYSERHHELVQKGFSMNIVELFEKIDKLEEYSEELLQQIGSYALVPEDIRKNVIISPSLTGYYYGGRFTGFN